MNSQTQEQFVPAGYGTNNGAFPVVGVQKRAPKYKNLLQVLMAIYLVRTLFYHVKNLLMGQTPKLGYICVNSFLIISAVLFLVFLCRYYEGRSTRLAGVAIGLVAVNEVAGLVNSYIYYKNNALETSISWVAVVWILLVAGGTLFVAADLSTKSRFYKISRIVYLCVFAYKVYNVGYSIVQNTIYQINMAKITEEFQYFTYISDLLQYLLFLLFPISILIFIWVVLKPAGQPVTALPLEQ